jgi:hypothetical protein
VLALGAPTAKAEAVNGSNPPFVPITRGSVRLSRDLTGRPSYREAFFATVVHEMGHVLGLQHAFTSGAMTVDLMRSTFRLRPLDSDDIAAISSLYPARAFQASTGTIAGRVTSGGQPVHLASVVAIRPNGAAVSALTALDGSYQIQGLPPDQYMVYAHPLPPATQDGLGPGDIILPLDPEGRPIPDSGPFDTVFFPGTRDPQQAAQISVARGGRADHIDFSVQRRSAVSIHDVRVYSFVGQQSIRPAFVNGTLPVNTVAIRGAGLIAGNAATPGLSIRLLDGSAIPANSVRPYGSPVSLAVDLRQLQGTGPRHLVFSTPADLFVLPNAFHVVDRQPPMVGATAPNTEGTVSVIGVNLTPDTKFFLDAIPAPVRAFNGSDSLGTATVALPPGVGNRAVVAAFNADGQNSTFGQVSAPTVSVEGIDSPAVRIEPSSVPAGTDVMVEVNAMNNTRFSDTATIGFGSSDIAVQRVWVVSPTRLLASVSVSAGAAHAATLFSVVNGFQILSQPFGFQVTPANPRSPRVSAALTNANLAQAGIFPGSIATLSGANLTTVPNGSSTAITLNDVRVTILAATPSQVMFQIPSGLTAGPAVLRLFNGQENAPPALVAIDAAPPVLVSLTPAGGRISDGVRQGDVVSAVISDPSIDDRLDPARVRVRFGDAEIAPAAVLSSAAPPNTYQILWIVPPGPGAGQVPVSIRVDDRISEPVTVSLRPL